MPVPSPFAPLLSDIPVREAEVEVLGSRTRYWEYGPEDAAATVVLAHGYRGDHHGLEPVIAQLPGIRFISPDLPGFGSSTPLREVPHSIPGYAAWLDAFLEALAVRGTAVLLGHSFGSIVVSHAIAAGTPAPRTILVNPIAGDPMRSGLASALPRLTRLFYRIGRGLPERAGRSVLGNRIIVRIMSVSLAKTADPRLRRWIHEEHERYFNVFSDPATLAEGFDASISTDVSHAAHALTMPTLMIAGALDAIAPPEQARPLARRLPDARLVVLDGVGHLVHYERPVEAAAAIRDFLEGA